MITFAAWVLAGIALWFTRSVLDMFGDAHHSTRVAMLPSLAELAGLIVLALLVSAGVASIVRRWTPSHFDRETARLQIALPLFGLGFVGLPYLPWLPDWVLPLRALAGPMTFVIWIVVVGQVVATALTVRGLVGRGRTNPLSYRRRAGIVAIFVMTFAVAGGAGWRVRDSLAYPSGDEPHHMIMMQSLWRDHDLHLQNNYDRLDYEEYFASSLEPATPRAPGLALLFAPAFAWGGYHGLMWMQVLLTAMAAVIMWRWALAFTGSAEAATVAWAGIFLGAPLLLTSFAIYPDIPAAFFIMVALAWRWTPERTDTTTGEQLIRGLAVSTLPWLSPTYTPLAVALIAIVSLRGRSQPRAVIASLSLFSLSLSACIFSARGWFEWQPELGNPAAGMLGLLFDQEFGVLPYAPALALGLVAVGRMAIAHDPVTRRHGREFVALLVALLVGVGSLEMWWGGAAPPGRMLVPILPVLGLPIAWAYRRGFESAVLRAGYQMLVFVGIAVSAAMVLAQDGGLVAQDRDGSARLLQWLTELWPAWEAVPSVAAFGARHAAPLVALWIVAAVAVGWLCARRSARPGAAALLATAYAGAGVLAVALLAPTVSRPPFQWVLEPESRSRVPMLDAFDAIVRPHAIIYKPFTFTRAESIPPLMTLSAFPGQRPAGQPVRVLLNARYALPAGQYEVEIGGLPGGVASTRGAVGLQVGRKGPPMHTWDVTLAPGAVWRSTFRLASDAEFVGFVAEPPLDQARSLRIRPHSIENRTGRDAIFHGARPLPVLSAIELPAASVFFHDEEVYPEQSGFWIRGGSTAVMTVAPHEPGRGVTVRLHGGAQPNTLTLVTTTWGEEVSLVPDTTREIHIPPSPRPGPFVLRVAAAKGFVPADVKPGSTDRRMLGGWMELTN